MFRKKEYSLTQKGLDAVDKIIKSSPQYIKLTENYKILLETITKDLRYYRTRGFQERGCLDKYIKKYEKIYKYLIMVEREANR